MWAGLANTTQTQEMKKFVCLGYRTASVIIALTDGELHEDLFFYSEREVSVLHTVSQGDSEVSGPAALRAKKRDTIFLWLQIFTLWMGILKINIKSSSASDSSKLRLFIGKEGGVNFQSKRSLRKE